MHVYRIQDNLGCPSFLPPGLRQGFLFCQANRFMSTRDSSVSNYWDSDMLLCSAFRGTQGFELRSSHLFSQHLTYKAIYSAHRVIPFHAVPFFVSLLYTDKGCVVCSDILDTHTPLCGGQSQRSAADGFSITPHFFFL